MKILLKNAMVITMNDKRKYIKKGMFLLRMIKSLTLVTSLSRMTVMRLWTVKEKPLCLLLLIPTRIPLSSLQEDLPMMFPFSPGFMTVSGHMRAI